MDSILATGLLGMRNGFERAAESSARLTRSFEGDIDDAVPAILDLQAAERQVETSAKIVKVGDSLLGSILDIIG
jgi:hypothetical protein